MRTPTHDERAATALASASVVGDIKAAEIHSCSTRSIRGWRKMVEDDAELAAACREKKAIVEADWAEKLPGAIRGCIAFLARAAAECDPSDPTAIHSMAGALKILAEVATTRQVLDVRLAKQAGQVRAEPFKVAS